MKTSKSTLMKNAHTFAKQMVGDYQARLSLGLKKAWEIARALTSNVGRRLGASGTTAYEVVKETQKAILVKVSAFTGMKDIDVEFWAPKSQLKGKLIPEWILARVELEKGIKINRF